MDADETLELRPAFDHDYDAYHPKNMKAARAAGLRYDPKTQTYVDADGFSILDKYAEPFVENYFSERVSAGIGPASL